MSTPTTNGASPKESRAKKLADAAAKEIAIQKEKEHAIKMASARPIRYSDLAAAYSEVSAERNWSVEGAWEGSQLVVLTGPEKGGKSWIIGDLVVCTILGGSWLGTFPVRKTGSVVVIEDEYGPHEYVRRLARIARGHGADDAAIARIIGVKGGPRGACRHYDGNDIQLDDASECEALVALRWDLLANPPALIVIDPIRNYIAGDENNNRDMLKALGAAAVLRDNANASVIAAHHLNRAGTQTGARALRTRSDLLIDGTDEEEPVYSAIGRRLRTGDKLKADRFSVEITHENDKDDTIAVTKLRLVKPGAAKKAKKNGLSANAEKILNALKALGGGRHSGYAIGHRAGITNGSARAAALGELLKAKAIVKDDDKKWSLGTADWFRQKQVEIDARRAAEKDDDDEDDDEDDDDEKEVKDEQFY